MDETIEARLRMLQAIQQRIRQELDIRRLNGGISVSKEFAEILWGDLEDDEKWYTKEIEKIVSAEEGQ